MKPRIVVIGSSNTDMVIKADRIPAPGETILGGTFFMNPGGKGANQAVAAARAGGNVTFICKTGNDMFGQQALQQFAIEGIDTSYASVDPNHPSGVAMIVVDRNGENSITVASGSNAQLLPSDLKRIGDVLRDAAIVLMQLETPVETVLQVASLAHAKGIRCILNPAPACSLPPELFGYLSIITPNESEAAVLSGIEVANLEDAVRAAKVIKEKGVATVIITLGPEGALVFHEGLAKHIPAIQVKPIDTTAAGDVFNGALAVGLSEGMILYDAVLFAGKAAAISVTRLGAQSSAPNRNEIDTLIT